MHKNDKSNLHVTVKLRLANSEGFFGPGIADLFREIDKCGNVRKACENCGFSYSKGWKIIRRCEKEFGFPVVDRQAGGYSGGTARVTDKGHNLLAVYDDLLAELEAVAVSRFAELADKYHLTEDVQNTEE